MTLQRASTQIQDVVSLVGEFQQEIWRYLRTIGCDSALADDLTQETFLAILNKPFQLRSRRESGAYLRKVARNLLLMFVRREKRKLNVSDFEAFEEVWCEVTGDSSDDWLHYLNTCLDGLTEREREAIRLRYYDGLSLEEMSPVVDLSVANLKTVLHRARLALRDCIRGKMSR